MISRIHNEVPSTLSGSHASFISGDFYFLPNRLFLPEGLVQTTCEGKNLDIVGSTVRQITAGSISFDKNEAIIATFGEFVERYCPTFSTQQAHNIVSNISYKDLSEKSRVVDLRYLQLYKKEQFDNGFPFKPITENAPIDWVKMYCHLNEENIFYPCELVFMPYSNSKKGKRYWSQTSTGLAAHKDQHNAVRGGYLECEERNAFAKWWYLQEHQMDEQVKYESSTVLEHYADNDNIQRLFTNSRVRIITYDLGNYSNVETVVCFMIFTYKEKDFIAIGCSSRFEKEEAIIKACMEAYQGVDYAILLCNRENWMVGCDEDFNLVDGFDKHYAFYNLFPEFRKNLPLYNNFLSNPVFQDIMIFEDKIKSLDYEKMKRNTNLPYLLSADLTTVDVRSLGFEVHRVAIPGFHLLTGQHKIPFLGLFDDKKSLFTDFPHPFP